MFDRLTALLGDAGVELSTDELLDILWIATSRGAGEPEEGPAPEPPARGRTAGPRGEEEDLDVDLDVDGPQDGLPDEGPAPVRPRGLYAPPAPGGGGRPSRAVGVHGVRALASPRALNRAMRPLRRTVASRTALVLDEQATVDRMAETGLPEPVLRPLPERWLTAALVVDDGPSMALWRQCATEVQALLQRQGAFQDVRTYAMDSAGGPGPLLRSGGAGTGAANGPRLDPTRPTLVLVLSDMVGERWRGGEIPAALRAWAARSPVAVLQPLPERMWPSSAGPVERLLVRAPYPAAPGGASKVRHPVFPDGLVSYSGTPIPVLELAAAHLTPWASLVTTARNEVPLPVLLLSETPGTRRGRPEPEPLGPQERFRRFREAASPESRQLAAALASVTPLTLPVMRLVHEAHRAEGGRFHPAQLAEVFLGGLLRRRDASRTTQAADSAEHEFHPGVAELLLDTVRTPVALDTAARVSEFLLRRGGLGPEFRARLDGDVTGATADLPEHAGPFAAASPQLLRRLGLAGAPQPAPEASPAAEPEAGPGPAAGAREAEVPEGPAELFIMTGVAAPLVAFAERLVADPAVPGQVRKRAERVIQRAHSWSAGYGWRGVTGVALLGNSLSASRQSAYQDELASVIGRLLEQLTTDTGLVTRNMRGNLAIALSELGGTKAALPHLRTVIDLSSQEHGPLHRYTLNARAYLHEMLYDAGWLREAEAEGTTLLEDFSRVGTEADGGVRRRFFQYQAYTLHDLGRLSEAEDLLRRVLAMESLAPAGRLHTLSWLAGVMVAQARYAEAERELRAGLDGLDGETDGSEAPVLDSLADLLSLCDRGGEAEPVRRATIRASERHFGADHPKSFRARCDWIRQLRAIGRHGEAKDEVEALESHAVGVLGALHGSTLNVRHLRTVVLADTKEYDEALAMQSRLLEEVTELLGAGHRTTLIQRHDHGLTLRWAGRTEEAAQWLRSVLADAAEHLGPDDRVTASTRHTLAATLTSLGRTDEAVTICRELLALEEQSLPEGSLRRAKTHRRLANLLAGAGDHEEAAVHARAVWNLYRRALGDEAPESLSAMHRYAFQLHKAGQHQAAIDVLERVASVRSRVLGPSDREALRSRMRLGDALAGLGHGERARAEWTAVREAATREWGEDDELVRTVTGALDSEAGPAERDG